LVADSPKARLCELEHLARPIDGLAVHELRANAVPRECVALTINFRKRPAVHQALERAEAVIVVQQSLPQSGEGERHLRALHVSAPVFERVLEPHFRKDRAQVIHPIRVVRLDALEAIFHERTERLAGIVMSLAVALHEKHRRGKCPFDVLEVRGMVFPGERQQPGAVGVHVKPGERAIRSVAAPFRLHA